MTTPTMKDKAGCDLFSGDFIVYGHALGRCAGLRYGVIIDIYEPKESLGWYPGKNEGKKKVHARIRGVDDDWERKDAKLLSKDSTLQFGDRILRVSVNQIPEKVRDLLKKVVLP